jgi:hypothetical protein
MHGLDIKTACITNIPIIILHDESRGVVVWYRCLCWRVLALRRPHNPTMDKHRLIGTSSCSPKRIETTSCASGITTSTTPRYAPALSLIETSHLIRSRNGQQMNGGSLVRCLMSLCVAQVVHHRVCYVGGRGTVSKQHILNVQPHFRLICCKLVDHRGRRSILLLWRRRWIGWGKRGFVGVPQCATHSVLGGCLVCDGCNGSVVLGD